MGYEIFPGRGYVKVPGRYTWAEAIQKHNDLRRVIIPSSSRDRDKLSYNKILLAKESGQFKPIPDDIARHGYFYSGTAAAIGAKGKPWKAVEVQCPFDDVARKIEIVFDAKNEQEAEVMLTCNHGFAPDGTPAVGFYTPDAGGVKGKLVQLCDATGNPTGEEMPDRVFLRFNGDVSSVRIQRRGGGVLETFNSEDVLINISDLAGLGLLSRANDAGNDRRCAVLNHWSFGKYNVAVEALAVNAPYEVAASMDSVSTGLTMFRVNVHGKPKSFLILNAIKKPFDAHPLVDAFNAEHGTSLTVISHKVADFLYHLATHDKLMHHEKFKGSANDPLPGFPNYLPESVVDAIIAYEKPGTRLGRKIVFDVPIDPDYPHSNRDGPSTVAFATGEYKGRKDIALVAFGLTSANFKEAGFFRPFTIDVPSSRLIAVPNFPPENGWYMPHAETGVPHGARLKISVARQMTDARYLNRWWSSYVGLLIRRVGYGGRGLDVGLGDGRSVDASRSGMFESLGLMAEVPEQDVPKIKALFVAEREKAEY